jgi:hypothetical protein
MESIECPRSAAHPVRVQDLFGDHRVWYCLACARVLAEASRGELVQV